MSEPSHVVVRGAHEHNLKSIDVRLPRRSLVVFTGVSGSGKSSLAFDTIHREGQRRFMESLSAYARQFLGQMERPKVDSIEGLSPTVCIDQKTVNRNPRSTVGTVTEIYDHLRLLFSRLGIPHCPICQTPISHTSLERLTDQWLQHHMEQTVTVLGSLVRERKGEYRKELDELRRDGWTRIRVDDAWRKLDEVIELARYEKHTIEVVIDRITVVPSERSRLVEAIEAAAKISGDGTFTLWDGERDHIFSSQRSCPQHPEVSIPELEPRFFSFNAPQGACPDCEGLGSIASFDPDRIVDQRRSIPEAFRVFNDEGRLPFTHFDGKALQDIARRWKVPLDRPLIQWPEPLRHKLLHGDPDFLWKSSIEKADGSMDVRERPWPGLVGLVENVWRWTRLPSLEPFRVEVQCRTCEGTRLNAIARSVRFRGQGIYELSSWSIRTAWEYFSSLQLEEQEREIGSLVIEEIRNRLQFLHEVGLDYLSLDRSAATLSGGEGQRIRLSAQVGSALQGVTYVLDEPSIGLHPRDNRRLLTSLLRLRDRGNTVFVVEHDAETILAADYVVDIGPGAGTLGGQLVAQGTPAEFMKLSGLTAEYLRGERTIPIPAQRRSGNGTTLRIVGAHVNNLRSVDVDIPLGILVVVTGVSGSGKSSLIFDVLEPSLKADAAIVGCSTIHGRDKIAQVITIDQSPIGRTPRSNPATYTGAMDRIRDLLAATPEARARGYKKGRFSFNVSGGRCEVCGGAGVQTIEMQFLPDVEVVCDACNGSRFNQETLDIRWKEKTIAQILDLTIIEALEFFQAIPTLSRTFQTLVDVGLGYIGLGQPATTLSGGEAQRLKLASELQRSARGSVLYLLDEPTTGLHFEDVRRLMEAIQRLVDLGHSVLIVEHHADVIKGADYVIDLGPEGGSEGGQIVGVGTPEQISCLNTPTGQVLAELFIPSVSLAAAPQPVQYSAGTNSILVRGARTHNLQNIDVNIRHGELTVITGPSGSGKTSLAFDTIFSEGQRRYVESLSTYARRFLGRNDRPPVERIEGLSPAIAIDQRHGGHNPRSTVATVTEIHDVLRILYAKVGTLFCPDCDQPLLSWTPTAGARELASSGIGKGWLVVDLRPNENPEELRSALIGQGWSRLWSNEAELSLSDNAAVVALSAGAQLIIDRFEPSTTPQERLAEAIYTAQQLGEQPQFIERASKKTILLPQIPTCPTHGKTPLGELTPRHFSFNSRVGACPDCEGLGKVRRYVPERLFPYREQGVWEAMAPKVRSILERSPRHVAMLEAVLKAFRSSPKAQVSQWPRDLWRAVLDGWKQPVAVQWTQVWGKVRRQVEETRHWEGLEEIFSEKSAKLAEFVAETECRSCGGGRLRRELLAVRIGGVGLQTLTHFPVRDAFFAVNTWTFEGAKALVAQRPLEELRRRLQFLIDVGLDYLSLDRAADSLSGGESQRIRLASQLGTHLTGVIYVLDEPTIGLHPQDTERLLNTLENLRDLGNTLLVVEHDPESIRRADHIIDMGPGSGRYGGQILAVGSPEEIRQNPTSLTGRWLAGIEKMVVPTVRRQKKGSVTLQGVNGHNLAIQQVSFPLGMLTVVSGVSGSGKSSLVLETLVPALQLSKGQMVTALAYQKIDSDRVIDRLVIVDQNPIGRTPRSTPATYCGIMDHLRALFAATPGAKERGWTPGRFSFNAEGGRCATCEGRGAILVEMHFLPDVWVTCDECNGKRYGRETLEVRWKGFSIADIMNQRADEALETFRAQRSLARPLQALVDVGLGYLTLGQPGNTLSGGEAQRVKLAAELVSRAGHVLYVLDEPTTGLHLADVAKLVEVFHRIVEAGHSMVVIEHHVDILCQADHLIELGPGGGDRGGQLIAEGTPEQISQCDTPTGRVVCEALVERGVELKTPAVKAKKQSKTAKNHGK